MICAPLGSPKIEPTAIAVDARAAGVSNPAPIFFKMLPPKFTLDPIALNVSDFHDNKPPAASFAPAPASFAT